MAILSAMVWVMMIKFSAIHKVKGMIKMVVFTANIHDDGIGDDDNNFYNKCGDGNDKDGGI